MGDLFDEGSTSTDDDFYSYVKRLFDIFLSNMKLSSVQVRCMYRHMQCLHFCIFSIFGYQGIMILEVKGMILSLYKKSNVLIEPFNSQKLYIFRMYRSIKLTGLQKKYQYLKTKKIFFIKRKSLLAWVICHCCSSHLHLLIRSVSR